MLLSRDYFDNFFDNFSSETIKNNKSKNIKIIFNYKTSSLNRIGRFISKRKERSTRFLYISFQIDNQYKKLLC